MQLGDMIDYVCGLCNQQDDATKSLVRGFLGKRYSVIYDSYPWRDTELTAYRAIDTTNVFDLPENMDRIIAIRSDGDTFLDPVDINLLLQTDPTILDRTGPPTSYREYWDGSSRRVQVFPTPSGAVELFIVGKRVINEFDHNSQTPIIRNIDNVLLAFGVYDLLRRQRQWDKAGKALEEANALLTAAQNLEKGQANQPRQSKQLTVAGNSLAELTDQVSAITGQYDPTSVVLIKNFLRSNYQMLWDACNWSEATVCATINNDGPEVILPSYFGRVLSVRFDPNLAALQVVEPSLVFGVVPQIFEQTGTSLAFSYLTPVGVGILPPTREKLSLSSTDETDKSNVFVLGEIEGEMASENVVLNGMITVSTVNNYDTPLTVSKGITKGDVIVTGYTTGTRLERILAAERERKHMRLWLQPTPQTAKVLLILGKRTMTPFAQDEDTTLLRDTGATLIAGAAADMFARLGNDKAAADQRAQAQASLKTLIDLETNQGAYSARIIPYTDTDDWSQAGYLTKGYA